MCDISEQLRNQRAKPRSCYNGDGETPKRSFDSRRAAKDAVRKGFNLKPYACELHGWHLGTPRK